MNGKRIYPDAADLHWLPEPGEYGRHPATGTWYARTPNGHAVDLRKHSVVEHDDGTITVSPSILVSDWSGPLWHGYLERGVWREC